MNRAEHLWEASLKAVSQTPKKRCEQRIESHHRRQQTRLITTPPLTKGLRQLAGDDDAISVCSAFSGVRKKTTPSPQQQRIYTRKSYAAPAHIAVKLKNNNNKQPEKDIQIPQFIFKAGYRSTFF